MPAWRSRAPDRRRPGLGMPGQQKAGENLAPPRRGGPDRGRVASAGRSPGCSLPPTGRRTRHGVTKPSGFTPMNTGSRSSSPPPSPIWPTGPTAATSSPARLTSPTAGTRSPPRPPPAPSQRTDRTRTSTRLPGDRHRGRRFRREPRGGTGAPGQPPEPRKARQVLPPPRRWTPDREVPRAAHPDGNECRALRRGRRPGLHLEVGSAALAGSPEAGLTAGERPPRGRPRHRQARARTPGTATGKA